MRTKVTLIFIVVTAVVLGIIFKNQIMSYFPKDAAMVKVDVLTNDILYHNFSREFVDYNSKLIKLDQEKMKEYDIAVFHMWASWCAPCVNEVPELIEFAHRAAKNKVKVLFVTVTLDDAQEVIAKFLKSFPKFDAEPFIRIWDKDKSISKFLNVDRLPMSVVLNKERTEPRVINGVVEWNRVEL